MRGYGLVDAVCHLINEAPYEKGDKSTADKQNKPPSTTSKSAPTTYTPSNEAQSNPHPQHLLLPRRNKDNYHVIAYLQNRGIDRDLIMDCIRRGVLYESALHHNAVFLGKDANDKTRFAALRGTRGNFKCDAEGSNKKYGFVVPPQNLDAYSNQANQAVMLFESPIDALSHQTLCNRGELPDFDGWRLSLGGTSTLPVIGFLEQHPNINHCIIATDNDEAGNAFADKMVNKLNMTTERVHPLQGKDWNEALLQTLRPETPSHQAEHTNEQAEPDL